MIKLIHCDYLNQLILILILTASTVKSDFKCLSDGVFEDPNDCQMYYECLWVGSAFEKQEHSKCVDDLIYNPKKHRCDNLSELDMQFDYGIKTADDLIEFIRFKNCFNSKISNSEPELKKQELKNKKEEIEQIHIVSIIEKLNKYLSETDLKMKAKSARLIKLSPTVSSNIKIFGTFKKLSKRKEPKKYFFTNFIDFLIALQSKQNVSFVSSMNNSTKKTEPNVSFKQRKLLAIEEDEEEEATEDDETEKETSPLHSSHQKEDFKTSEDTTNTKTTVYHENEELIDSIEERINDKIKQLPTEKETISVNSSTKVILRDVSYSTITNSSTTTLKTTTEESLTTKLNEKEEPKTDFSFSDFDLVKYFSTLFAQNLTTKSAFSSSESSSTKPTTVLNEDKLFYTLTTTMASTTSSKITIPPFSIRNINSSNDFEPIIAIDYDELKISKLKSSQNESNKYQSLTISPEDTLIECKENDFGLECSCSITLSPPKCKGLINSFLSSCKILGCKNNGKCITIAYKYPIPYVCSCPGMFMGSYCEISRERIDPIATSRLTPKKTMPPITTKRYFKYSKTTQFTRRQTITNPSTKTTTKKYTIFNEYLNNNSEFKEPICIPNPCMNKGVCIIIADRFECKCFNTSFSGKYCEKYSAQKHIQSTTTTKLFSRHKYIPKNYLTSTHQTTKKYLFAKTTSSYNDLWQCKSNCNNNLGHGFCTMDALSNPKCVCNGDWTGQDCNQKNYCLYNRCTNNSTCINHPPSQSYICLCPSVYSGNYCEIRLKKTPKNWNKFHEFDESESETETPAPELEQDELIENNENLEQDLMVPVGRMIKSRFSSTEKCRNNGTYLENISACKCKKGYYGKKCELRSNVCSSNPCDSPKSECVPLSLDKYECVCPIDAENCPSTTNKSLINKQRSNNAKSNKKTKLRKTTTTTTTPLPTTTTPLPTTTTPVSTTEIIPEVKTFINICKLDNELCLKYPNGNESFICVPDLTTQDYTQCLPAKTLSCIDMNPCLNGGLCIQNNDMSLMFKTNQSISFKCICPDNYSGQLCETEICSPIHALLSNHSMCSPTSSNLVLEEENIKNTDIDLIVRMHNDIRQRVVPKSSNMQKMYWDKRLEILAVQRAQMCSIEAGGVLTRQLPGYGIVIGENLAAGYEKWENVIESWLSENSSFVFRSDTTSENSQTGHYTQIIYSSASRIGCGYAQCSNTEYNSYFVCYYGEMQTQSSRYEPYLEGETCDLCKDNCDNGLCDCKGIFCQNGGKLDLTTCTCSCPYATFTGRYCENVNCPSEDSQFCSKALFEHKCWLYPVIRASCPFMCKLCKNENEFNATVAELNRISFRFTELQDLIKNVQHEL